MHTHSRGIGWFLAAAAACVDLTTMSLVSGAEVESKEPPKASATTTLPEWVESATAPFLSFTTLMRNYLLKEQDPTGRNAAANATYLAWNDVVNEITARQKPDLDMGPIIAYGSVISLVNATPEVAAAFQKLAVALQGADTDPSLGRERALDLYSRGLLRFVSVKDAAAIRAGVGLTKSKASETVVAVMAQKVTVPVPAETSGDALTTAQMAHWALARGSAGSSAFAEPIRFDAAVELNLPSQETPAVFCLVPVLDEGRSVAGLFAVAAVMIEPPEGFKQGPAFTATENAWKEILGTLVKVTENH